jgi:N-acetylmuramoyl-L-alanine amidase
MTRSTGARILFAATAALWLAPAVAQETIDAPPAAPAATAPVITDARIVGDKKRARFIADVSEAVDVGVFTLADPYRIVIDLPEVRFALPADAAEEGRGLLSEFRYGLLSPGKSRIVLDVSNPVKVDKQFVVPPAPGQPARLVIDVVPTSRAKFLEIGRAYRETQALAAAAERDRSLKPAPKPASGKTVIVIDPGHGGIDNGAKGTQGGVEKNVTLAFAKKLGEKLGATGLYEIHFTRKDDSFVGLDERMAIARRLGADLFVSVHANSFGSRSIRGAIIYTVSEGASDAMAAEIAASENRSDALAGLDIPEDDTNEVLDILLDLTRRETRNFGVVFARNLVKELKTDTKMFKVPHQRAGFKVLEAPDVPSAMIELGFMSNPDDEKLLLSEEWRDKAASAVVRAIAAYFRTKLAQGGPG